MGASCRPDTRPTAATRVSALKIRPLTDRAGMRVSGKVTPTTQLPPPTPRRTWAAFLPEPASIEMMT